MLPGRLAPVQGCEARGWVAFWRRGSLTPAHCAARSSCQLCSIFIAHLYDTIFTWLLNGDPKTGERIHFAESPKEPYEATEEDYTLSAELFVEVRPFAATRSPSRLTPLLLAGRGVVSLLSEDGGNFP